MIFFRYFILFFFTTIHLDLSHAFYVSKFIKDFFYAKNVMMTVHVCWSIDEVKDFLVQVSVESRPKQTSVYRNGEATDTFFRHLSPDNYFVLDLTECNSSWILLDHVNRSGLFRFPLKYLLLVQNIDELSFKLENYTIYPTSELVIGNVFNGTVQLLQPYRIDRHSAVIWEDYGIWTESSGLVHHLSNKTVPQRRFNLKRARVVLPIVITNNDSWNHLDDFRFPQIDVFTKESYGAVSILMDYCNLDAFYNATEYFGYYNNKTGEWNGIINELHQGRGHISGTPPFFTLERSHVVEFLKMQNPATLKFVLKKPPISYVRSVFEVAFKENVWFCLGITLLAFAVALFFILNLEARRGLVNYKNKFSVSDVVLIVFEAVCQQGTTTEPKRYSSRISAVVLFMALMFIYVSYSANIVVLLQSETEIKTLKELLESRIAAGAMDNNYMKYYLTESTDEVRRQLYEKKIGPSGYYPFEEGMRKVQDGFFAYHVEIAAAYVYILEKFTEYDICSLQELEGYIQHMKGYMAVPKNSPYKEIFKVGLLRIDEHGLHQRNFIRWFRTPKCHFKGSSFESVGIVETYQVLVVLTCGALLSVVICLIENLVKAMDDRKISIRTSKYTISSRITTKQS